MKEKQGNELLDILAVEFDVNHSWGNLLHNISYEVVLVSWTVWIFLMPCEYQPKPCISFTDLLGLGGSKTHSNTYRSPTTITSHQCLECSTLPKKNANTSESI